MLLLATFPVAFMAGVGSDSLVSGLPRSPGWRRDGLLCLLGVLLAVVLLGAGAVLKFGQPFHFFPYWASLFVTVPAMVGLVLTRDRIDPSTWAFGWSAVLLTDLWTLSWPLVQTRAEQEVYVSSRCVRTLAEDNEGHHRVLDRGWSGHQSASPLGSGAPLAMLRRIEPVRGYNPLDVLRYKEYLQFITDRDSPLRALDGPLTFPVVDNFAVTNESLVNLLGVRFILQPSDQPPASKRWQVVGMDEHPEAYDFVAGGWPKYPAYTLYENPDALPRAFIVPEAAALPDRADVLAALKQTDFRRRVLLEGVSQEDVSHSSDGRFRPALITEYEPNRVVVNVAGNGPDWLVLTDVWYPGWTCVVDGEDKPVYRADFLFRAVRLPAGAREVVFTFAPASYRRGGLVSIITLAGVVAVSLLSVFRALRATRRHET